MLLPSLLAALLAAAPPHDPEGRFAALSARLQQAPLDAPLRLERARLALALGDLLTARADLAVAARVAAADGAVAALTAELEARAGNDVAVLQACRRAGELGVHAPGLLRLQGRALAQLRRHAEAATAFAAAGPAAPAHWLELAAARDAAGDADAARAALTQALQQLGPVVGLVDAAVALDVRAGRFAAALAAIETLRPFVRRPGVLAGRRARVFTAMGAAWLAATEGALAAAAAVAPAAAPAVAAPAPAAVMPPPPAPPLRLVPTGSPWRYWDRALPPAAGWQLPGFDDTNWPSGLAQLGYGDGDEATVLQAGPAGAHHPVAWFRHVVQLPAGAPSGSARARVLCDDGAVVYLNGVEIGRWNLPNGPLVSILPAATAVAGAQESAWHTFAFAPSLLVPGTNVIAVEVHQVGPTSSDLSFDCSVELGNAPITVLRGPYLQNGTPSGATVRWRTDQPTTTQLWLGASPTTLQPVWFDAVRRTDHAATVTGLAPETTYHYAIGDAAGPFPGQAAATLRTLPPAGAVRPLRAWVLGDAGSGLPGQYAVRDQFAAFAAAAPPDLVLLLGDNAYPSGTDAEYQVGVFDVYGERLRDTFSWSALGNHDATFVQTASQAGTWYDVFTLPRAGEAGGLPSGTEAYWSFDRGHVHFVCLDSMDSDRTATGAMMTWLQADLAATNARWLVAFFHHPPYSAGSHHSDNPLDSGGRMIDMRQVALPILEAAGVDLVLCGHSHSYERSFLLDGHYGPSPSLQPAMVRDRGDGSAAGDGVYGKPSTGLAGHQGAVYVVAGSAGATGGGLLNHPAMHVSLDRLGSFVLDIDGDRLDGRFLGPGGVEDAFTLVKGDTRTLWRDQPRIPVAAGGRQDFTLAAGPQHANRFYVLAGAQGTVPGLVLGGLPVPLNADPWLQLSLSLANTAVYPNSIGVLDANGQATAALVMPPLAVPSLVGQVLWHAYLVGDGSGFVHASNAVKVTFTP